MDADQARSTMTDERRRLVEMASRARGDAPEPGTDEEGTGQHAADMGTDRETQLEDEGLADDADRQVTEIDEALARLEDGTWGTCVVCGREIDAERLDAKPTAARCREHQQEFEAASR